MNTTQTIAVPLQQLLAGLSHQGERHLGEVQADLRQTTYLLGAAIEKLGKSFIGIHESMLAQQALLAAQVSRDPAVTQANLALLARLTQLQDRSRAHADAAITALQFEDMTGQLIGRIVGHVDSLQSMLGTLGTGAAALTGENAPNAAIAAVLASLNGMLDAQSAEAPSVAKKAVAQTHMDSGDIELF